MFTFNVTLPYYGDLRVEELSNRDIFTIFKYCTADDAEGLSLFFENVIFSKLPWLNVIDKLCLLLFYRSFYLDDTIQIKVNHEKAKHMDFFIDNMLEKISSLDIIDDECVTTNNIKVILSLPSTLYHKTNEDIIYNCIKSVKIDNETIVLHNLSKAEKNELLDNLPAKITSKILEYFKTASDKTGSVSVIGEHKHYEIDEVGIQLLSNQPIEFIKILFKQDMANYLEFMYHYVNKVGGTFEDFLNMTFNDTKIILDFYREEVVQQNESLKSPQPTTI